jgi:DNA-directed RNA polymerase specialized sigma24 family protein
MPTSASRESELAAFYAKHANRLHRIVAARAHRLGDAVIDDACQFAWTTISGRPDVTLDARGLNWLATVAIRQAWDDGTRLQRERPAGGFQPTLPNEGVANRELPQPPADELDVLEQVANRIEHETRVQQPHTLLPRERRDLYLHACGFKYQEIAHMTRSTYTAVNRRITEARARLRRLTADTENDTT